MRRCRRLVCWRSLALETLIDWQIAVYVVCWLMRWLEVFQIVFPQTEEELLEALKGDDPTLAATAEAMLWRTWCRSGNSEADRIFRAGVDAMQQGQLEEAAAEFTRVIDIAPEFAEGWNKRATVRFMREDFAGSIADCQETLARNPNHFGASSGAGTVPHLAGRVSRGGSMFSPRAGDSSPSRCGTLQLGAGGS